MEGREGGEEEKEEGQRRVLCVFGARVNLFWHPRAEEHPRTRCPVPTQKDIVHEAALWTFSWKCVRVFSPSEVFLCFLSCALQECKWNEGEVGPDVLSFLQRRSCMQPGPMKKEASAGLPSFAETQGTSAAQEQGLQAW